MAGERRAYRRETEERRREDLVAAALALMAEGGPQATTVRAIADRAGVTPGLIRHYFLTKDDLTREAYRALMEQMTEQSRDALGEVGPDPAARLVAFLSRSLRPPVMERKAVLLWAAFMHHAHLDPEMAVVHEQTYLNYRNQLQSLIEDLPTKPGPVQARLLAIACNAVIDGLWLEGGTLSEAFVEDELVVIGITAVGAILGMDLSAHLPNASIRETQ